MKQLIKGLLLSLAMLPALAFSHGAPRITVEESIVIKADPDVVWNAIKDFDNAHSWMPIVKAIEAKGGNNKGATRTLTLENGATISEELLKFNEETMSYQYEITDISKVGEIDDHGEMHEIPALPVSKYKSWISVKAVDGDSKVSWKGKFFRAYHGKHHPPKELDDNAAKNAVSDLYTSSLKNLKAKLEK